MIPDRIIFVVTLFYSLHFWAKPESDAVLLTLWDPIMLTVRADFLHSKCNQKFI
jgi:hypothetical protein